MDIKFSIWPPRANCKARVSRNCDTNAHIKFIFDTAIDDPEWKNPIDFGENRKTKMVDNLHNVTAFCKKYAEKACARHNFIRNESINCIFNVAIDLPWRKVSINFGENRATKR